MDIRRLIGSKKSVPSIDFNLVVKSDNLRYWRISKATWEKDKVELHITFEKDGIQSSLDKTFNTIMEAVEYFYNFLKTI
jgi:hypothetical protein